MPDLVFERDSLRLTCRGISLNRPVDSLPPEKFPFLENVRSYQGGRIEPRGGLTSLGAVITGKTPVHSLRRLNDPQNSLFTYVLGAQDRLAYGTVSPFTDADGAYSGDPLALVPWRPDQSPDAWMYVADRSRMRKLRRDGTLHQIGLPAPTVAPTAVLAQPAYKVIHEFDTEVGLTGVGTGVLALLNWRVNTTITSILYDAGTTGWACVEPASMVQIGVGCRLNFNPGGGSDEIATVQEVHPSNASTSIASIIYDSGSTGLCSVVLTIPLEEIEANSYVNIAAAEKVRVLSVTRGRDETTSFRCSTTATRAAGDSVVALGSFRVYLVNNHGAAETVRGNAVNAPAVATGTGTITQTTTIDLSAIALNRPTRPEDYVHISIRVNRPDLVSEGKVMLDVDSATNDFTRNFYYRAFRSSDLTPSVRNAQTLLTTRQQVIRRKLIDRSGEVSRTGYSGYYDYPYGYPPGPQQEFEDVVEEVEVPLETSEQTSPGDVQWTELRFRVADLIRVGTDHSRTLRNVAAIRISLTTTGTVSLDLDSWWLGGGFGPDLTEEGVPYSYRYRARVTSTGAKSNPSPPLRTTLSPLRGRITITPTQYTAATEADVLDIERFGGSIAEWHYIGTVANTASPSFTDDIPDDVAAQGPQLGRQNFQPWPVIDTPKTGTTGTVSGTTVDDTATNFSTSWAQGTVIKIGSSKQPYTIYRVISTSRLELYENAGSGTAVPWEVEEPILIGQNLPCLWGPFNDTLFACGDPKNPGRLYFANRNDPDSTSENGWIDITPPSEPLMNGVVYESSRCYVFSTRRMFQVLSTGEPANRYTYQEIVGARGLFSRWALTRIPGPSIAYLGEDGSIWETQGGTPQSLTDADLYPLFPNEGVLGAAVNTLNAPNIVPAQAVNLRLDWAKDILYFDYPDTAGARRTLAYFPELKAWFPDVYTPGLVFHYGEEGGSARDSTVLAILAGGANATTALFYQLTGNDDAGTAFTCKVRTASRDQGDARAVKLYGDALLDVDTAGVDLTVTPGFDNHSTLSAAVTVNSTSRLQRHVSVGSAWVVAKNASLNIQWTQNSANKPKLYIWETRWHEEPGPVFAVSWETPALTHDGPGFMVPYDGWMAHVSTTDLTLVVTVDGVAQAARTIANNGGAYKRSYVRLPVYKGKSLKYRLSSTAEFRVYGSGSELRIRNWSDGGPLRRIPWFNDLASRGAA